MQILLWFFLEIMHLNDGKILRKTEHCKNVFLKATVKLMGSS